MARATSAWLNGSHLPPHLEEVVAPIEAVAILMERSLNNGPEKSAGMRKLLEAKDCFVRQAIEDAEGTS